MSTEDPGTPTPTVMSDYDPRLSEPSEPRYQTVGLPGRFTQKVLIAFIDESNPDDSTNVLWAANLHPEHVEITGDGRKVKLNLTLSMEDIYGNTRNSD